MRKTFLNSFCHDLPQLLVFSSKLQETITIILACSNDSRMIIFFSRKIVDCSRSGDVNYKDDDDTKDCKLSLS